MIQQSLKKCPFCAEDIQAEAIRCKHCQSLLMQNISQPLKSLFGTHLKNIFLNKPKWTPAKIFAVCFVLFMIGLLILGSNSKPDKNYSAAIKPAIVSLAPSIKIPSKLYQDGTAGHAEAQRKIADLYQDACHYREASDWYEKAAIKGDLSAQITTGQNYLQGDNDVIQNSKTALRWFETAYKNALKNGNAADVYLCRKEIREAKWYIKDDEEMSRIENLKMSK